MKNLDNSSLFKNILQCVSKKSRFEQKLREIWKLSWDRLKINFNITKLVIKSIEVCTDYKEF